MLQLSQTQQLTVEGALLTTLDLACIRVTLPRVNTAHVAPKRLPSSEVLVTRITVELDGSDSRFVNPWLLR